MKAPQAAAVIMAAALFAVCTAQTARLPLRDVADVPLTGRATRLDYQSFDAQSGRLYVAHLGDDMVTVFDTNAGKVVGDVKDLKSVHGVLAVPELRRVYATATGTDELAVIDDQTLQVVARVPAGDYPDGVAYASKEGKLYVSDKRGKTDAVIDAKTNQRVATIRLAGGAGNTQAVLAGRRRGVEARQAKPEEGVLRAATARAVPGCAAPRPHRGLSGGIRGAACVALVRRTPQPRPR